MCQMKSKIFNALLSASLAFVFAACEDTAINMESENESSADSVVVRDQLAFLNSIHFKQLPEKKKKNNPPKYRLLNICTQ